MVDGRDWFAKRAKQQTCTKLQRLHAVCLCSGTPVTWLCIDRVVAAGVRERWQMGAGGVAAEGDGRGRLYPGCRRVQRRPRYSPGCRAVGTGEYIRHLTFLTKNKGRLLSSAVLVPREVVASLTGPRTVADSIRSGKFLGGEIGQRSDYFCC